MAKKKANNRLFSYLDRYWLVVAVVIGAMPRFGNISKSSIWHDEGYTMMLSPQSPGQIIARTGRDVHPPLYYLTLHYWMTVFGSSEIGARSLSATLMLATIIPGYLLIKRLFGRRPAQLAALFLALGPFLIRYSQEARMYGMVAFLLTLATWLLVRAVQDGRKSDWILYALTIAAALYTHYYSVFVIAAHWVYMAVETRRPGRVGLKSRRWWGANVLAAVLFLPWVPVAYHQFARVQGSFWIPPVGPNTLPSTIGQFLTFTDMGAIPLIRLLAFAGVAIGVLVLALAWQKRQNIGPVVLLVAFTVVGPLSVFALSFKRPIYVDRYFVFAAVGFYMTLAVLLYCLWPFSKWRTLRLAAIVIVLLTFIVGIRNVYSQANHKMRTVAGFVNANFQPGDGLISGELYTYFDFSYYNHTGQVAQLWATDGVNGYGESSLLYDRADQVVVRDLSSLHPATGRLWMVGKTGPHDYFDHVPSNWSPIGPRYEAGYVATQLYAVH